jgi:ribosome maturation factor RimP
MTSKSSKKDYKALYEALKIKHDFVLEMSSKGLDDALTRLKEKDREIAKYKKLFEDFNRIVPKKPLEPKFDVRGYIDSRKEAEATAKFNVMNYIDDRIAKAELGDSD